MKRKVRISKPCMECGGSVPSMANGGQNEMQNPMPPMENQGSVGRCTGTNFGGPDCPKGSQQYILAQKFRKELNSYKKKEAPSVAEQNKDINSVTGQRNNTFKDFLARNTSGVIAEEEMIQAMQQPQHMMPDGTMMPGAYHGAPEQYYTGGPMMGPTTEDQWREQLAATPGIGLEAGNLGFNINDVADTTLKRRGPLGRMLKNQFANEGMGYDALASYGRQKTEKDYEQMMAEGDETSADRVFRSNRDPNMGNIAFNDLGLASDPTKFTPVQFAGLAPTQISRYGGPPKYFNGGSNMSDYGYDPSMANINPMIQAAQQQQQTSQDLLGGLGNMFENADLSSNYVAKSKIRPEYKDWYKDYNKKYKKEMRDNNNPFANMFAMMYGGQPLPQAQYGVPGNPTQQKYLADNPYNQMRERTLSGTADAVLGNRKVQGARSNRPLSEAEMRALELEQRGSYRQRQNEYAQPVNFNNPQSSLQQFGNSIANSSLGEFADNVGAGFADAAAYGYQPSGVSAGMYNQTPAVIANQRRVMAEMEAERERQRGNYSTTSEDEGADAIEKLKDKPGNKTNTGDVSTTNTGDGSTTTETDTTTDKTATGDRKGNVEDEEGVDDTTTGDGTTATGGTDANGQPLNVIYPSQGLFGRRGSAPLFFNPNDTHLSNVQTRRAILPGNRIKSMTFSHGVQTPGISGQQVDPNTGGFIDNVVDKGKGAISNLKGRKARKAAEDQASIDNPVEGQGWYNRHNDWRDYVPDEEIGRVQARGAGSLPTSVENYTSPGDAPVGVTPEFGQEAVMMYGGIPYFVDGGMINYADGGVPDAAMRSYEGESRGYRQYVNRLNDQADTNRRMGYEDKQPVFFPSYGSVNNRDNKARYAEGGEYDLTEAEIQQIISEGGEVEFI